MDENEKYSGVDSVVHFIVVAVVVIAVIALAVRENSRADQDDDSAVTVPEYVERNSDGSYSMKCNVPENFQETQYLSRFDYPMVALHIDKIKSLKIEKHSYVTLSFQNNTDFTVGALALGIPNEKTCPSSLQDYDAIFACKGRVEAGIYGDLVCPWQLAKSSRRKGYCVIGLLPSDLERSFDKKLYEYSMRKLGLCG